VVCCVGRCFSMVANFQFTRGGLIMGSEKTRPFSPF
jgi:hypothetical protein